MPITRPRSAPRRAAAVPTPAATGCHLGRITAVDDDGGVGLLTPDDLQEIKNTQIGGRKK